MARAPNVLPHPAPPCLSGERELPTLDRSFIYPHLLSRTFTGFSGAVSFQATGDRSAAMDFKESNHQGTMEGFGWVCRSSFCTSASDLAHPRCLGMWHTDAPA